MDFAQLLKPEKILKTSGVLLHNSPMNYLKKTLICLSIIIFSSSAFADSPLTSTNFAAAYTDQPMVIAASKTEGYINNYIMDYLTSDKYPIDVKMAIINEFGWKISGKNNSQAFWVYLKNKHGYVDKDAFIKAGKADELLAMAYISALDDYFNVDDAIVFAEKALEKNPESRTFNLIAGLIKAQKTMDSDWCEVYKITDRIRKNIELKNDMKPEAVKIIYDYVDIYGDECK
jgi:hypothetical protein